MKQILLKQWMSGAKDAMTQYHLDAEAQIIEVEQITLMGESFLSTSMLESLILRQLPRDEGIEAFNDDDVDSFTPARTPWKIYIRMGELRLRAVVWKHRPERPGVQRSTVELYPEYPLPANRVQDLDHSL
jgi:hypothetical protein